MFVCLQAREREGGGATEGGRASGEMVTTKHIVWLSRRAISLCNGPWALPCHACGRCLIDGLNKKS